MYFDKYPTSPQVVFMNNAVGLSRNNSSSSSAVTSTHANSRHQHTPVNRTLSNVSNCSQSSQIFTSSPNANIHEDINVLKDENSRVRSSYHQLREEFNELEDLKATVSAERDHWKMTADRSQQELHQLRKLITSSVDSGVYDQLRLDLDQAHADLDLALTNNRTTQQELHQAMVTIGALQAESTAVQQRCKELEEESGRLQDEKERFERFVVEYGEMADNYEICKDKLNQIISENEDLKGTLQKYSAEHNLTFRRPSSSSSPRPPTGSDSLHFLAYDQQMTGSNISLVTLSSYPSTIEYSSPNSHHNQNRLLTSSTSIQALSTPSKRPSISSLSYLGTPTRGANNINPLVASSACRQRSSLAQAESLITIRARDLELQLEEERTEKMDLVTKLEELKNQMQTLEQQSVLDHERITTLENELVEKRQNHEILNLTEDDLWSTPDQKRSKINNNANNVNSITRSEIKFCYVTKPINDDQHQVSSPAKMSISANKNDDRNNNPKKRSREEDSDRDSVADNKDSSLMTVELVSFKEGGGDGAKNQKSPKKRKKRWFRFLICAHSDH